jgi:hypothetical protein
LRVLFLVDGFNLYHSANELRKDLAAVGATGPVPSTKWLDIRGMLGSCLSLISPTATLGEVHYFSALAHFREAKSPGTVNRHRDYIRCLEDTGVVVSLGRFKEKPASCRRCGDQWMRPEEKETDVAIATTLLELLCADRFEVAMMVSGDTDLAPALRAANRLKPAKKVGFIFPYRRRNAELSALSPGLNFKLKRDRYIAHQFSDPYITAAGVKIAKPVAW